MPVVFDKEGREKRKRARLPTNHLQSSMTLLCPRLRARLQCRSYSLCFSSGLTVFLRDFTRLPFLYWKAWVDRHKVCARWTLLIAKGTNERAKKVNQLKVYRHRSFVFWMKCKGVVTPSSPPPPGEHKTCLYSFSTSHTVGQLHFSRGRTDVIGVFFAYLVATNTHLSLSLSSVGCVECFDIFDRGDDFSNLFSWVDDILGLLLFSKHD